MPICDINVEYAVKRDWTSGSCAKVDERIPPYVSVQPLKKFGTIN